MSTGSQDDAIIGDLTVGLMTEDPMANPIPGMAMRWTTSADGLTWTFYLRQALWSDGMPVTAQDFVFSWRRLLDPATAAPYAYFLYVVKNAEPVNAGKLPPTALGVRALDDHTPGGAAGASGALSAADDDPHCDLSRSRAMWWRPRAGTGRRPGNHVGNGAFTLKEWVPNGHVLLVKNPRFYDAANVALERVYLLSDR